MMQPLRLAAVVAALLVSGFTAEHLASQAQPHEPPPEATPTALPEAPTARAARPAPEAPVSRRLPMGPVRGPVSSPFGPRVHPVSGRASHHDGVDLAVPAGTAASVALARAREKCRLRQQRALFDSYAVTTFWE